MRELEQLLEIMARLRDPDSGCPWDLEQDFSTIAPYTLEEAYEVAEAIARGDMEGLEDELGDLLFQVVFHARMAEERGLFDFSDVARGICEKMLRRHPHVFGEAEVADAETQTRAWEAHKAAERAARGRDRTGVLDGVPVALPALVRAQKLGRRAAGTGFDWPDADGVLEKLAEELAELDAARAGKQAQVEDEAGDLLFTVVNLCRHLGVDAEGALRAANAKFAARFRRMEHALAEAGRTPADASALELEALWDEAKRRGRDD